MGTAQKVDIYDTTLRDGAQKKGVSYSLEDKLHIAKELDALGVSYIEGGWPGSNPKDRAFFERVAEFDLQAKVVAFGSTRRKETAVEDDVNLQALIEARTPAVAIVGKSWLLHVEEVIRTTPEENLRMISESVAYCASQGREVVYDAEHFFDGFKNNPSYALQTLHAAAESGARVLVLCDTNGGTMTSRVAEVCDLVRKEFSGAELIVGIHAHNDSELAVANSQAAVEVGARHVQGTINGYGERCGNANLVSIIPNLQLKLGFSCVPQDQLKNLRRVSSYVSNKANIAHDVFQPYVGSAAFAHKGGIHVAAVERCANSYEHIEPSLVGNRRDIVVSELSGKGNIRMMSDKLNLSLQSSQGKSEALDSKTLAVIKEKEQEGYVFEDAEASVELLIRRMSDSYQAPFLVNEYKVISEGHYEVGSQEPFSSPEQEVQAIVCLTVGDTEEHRVAKGFGPVNALDNALRKALLPYYPRLNEMSLTDYKVRILDPDTATSAITRVMIDASKGDETWTTVFCARNIIEASFHALVESYELFLLRQHSEKLEKVV